MNPAKHTGSGHEIADHDHDDASTPDSGSKMLREDVRMVSTSETAPAENRIANDNKTNKPSSLRVQLRKSSVLKVLLDE